MFEVFNDSTTQQENFQRVANRLLNECFLIKKSEGTRKDYFFVMQNLEVFKAVFDVLGYEIKVNQDFGVMGLTNKYNKGRLRLDSYQSIFLCILSILYYEKREDLSYSSEVVVRMEDIRAKYNAMKNTKKPYLNKSIERECIQLFRRYNLIDNLDADIQLSEARIVIYPSIIMAVTSEDVNKAYDYIVGKCKDYTEQQESSCDSSETMQAGEE